MYKNPVIQLTFSPNNFHETAINPVKVKPPENTDTNLPATNGSVIFQRNKSVNRILKSYLGPADVNCFIRKNRN